MNWSRPDYTASPDAEESYKQMSRRKGLDLESYGNSGRDELKDMRMVERNGMIERCGSDPKESDAERKESEEGLTRRDVDCTRSDVGCIGRDVVGNESNFDCNGGVTSDVAH